MGTVLKLLILGAFIWMIMPVNPDIAEGTRTALSPHAAIRVVVIGIVIGLFVVIYRQRRS